MQWIRENLFLTCLVGALVVCLGGLYVIRSGQDTGFKKDDMGPRQRLALRIDSLARFRSFTKIGLQRAQKRLDKIRRQRDDIVKEATRWNKRNYSVLKLRTGVGTKTVAAFPYDKKAYQSQDLTSKFTNGYRKALYGALAALDLTTWPADTEIGELSGKIEKDLLAGQKVATNRVKYVLSQLPKPDPDSKEPPKKPAGVSDEDWYLYNLTDEGVNTRARHDATEELMLEKAKAGSIFVSPKTLAMVTAPKLPGAPAGPEELDVIFPEVVWQWANAPAPKLWAAQLNLWITQDILAIIDATNDESLKPHGSNRTVPNAAIKLLRNINIEEAYLTQSGDKNSNSALTGRVTDTDHEIVEYNFVIVMNTAYLPALMQNVAERGDHTVTKVMVERLPVAADANRYYGTDPVSLVTIGGEALFRADWTRKIMPIEFLRDELSSVLGEDDRKRVEEEEGQ